MERSISARTYSIIKVGLAERHYIVGRIQAKKLKIRIQFYKVISRDP